jgi:hypothetical protein
MESELILDLPRKRKGRTNKERPLKGSYAVNGIYNNPTFIL